MSVRALFHRTRRAAPKAAASAAALLIAPIFIFPFLWLVLAAFKSNADIFRVLPLWPVEWIGGSYGQLLSSQWTPFTAQFSSSLWIASSQTVLAIAVTSMAGFLFGLYDFMGRRLLYGAAIAAVFIPNQVMAVSFTAWMERIKLIDNSAALILSGAVSGLGILLFTYIFRRLPPELSDAARAEGASEYRVFWLVLPLIKPALITFGFLHFTLAWHEHLLALAVLQTPEKFTVSLALASLFGSSLHIPLSVVMAGAALSILPTAVVFVLAAKHFESTLASFTS